MLLVLLPALATLAGCEVRRRSSADTDAGATLATAPSASTTAARDPNAPFTLAERDGVHGVVVDRDFVYWSTNWTTHGIRRLGRKAGAATDAVSVCALADKMATAEQILVDDTHVYLVATSPGSATVYRAPKGAVGVACEKLALADPGRQPLLVRAGKFVYVVGGPYAPSTVTSIDATGKTTKVRELPMAVEGATTDGTLLYLSVGEGSTRSLVRWDPASGGAPDEIAKVGGILGFGSGQLFVLSVNHVLSTLSPTGRGSKPLVSDASGGFVAIGDTVYTGAGTLPRRSATVQKAPIAGGTKAVDLATIPGTVTAMAGDERDLYVAAGRSLLRFAP